MVAPKDFPLFVSSHFQLVLELDVCMVHIRYVKSSAPELRLKWSRLQLENLTVCGKCVIKYDGKWTFQLQRHYSKQLSCEYFFHSLCWTNMKSLRKH